MSTCLLFAISQNYPCIAFAPTHAKPIKTNNCKGTPYAGDHNATHANKVVFELSVLELTKD